MIRPTFFPWTRSRCFSKKTSTPGLTTRPPRMKPRGIVAAVLGPQAAHRPGPLDESHDDRQGRRSGLADHGTSPYYTLSLFSKK